MHHNTPIDINLAESGLARQDTAIPHASALGIMATNLGILVSVTYTCASAIKINKNHDYTWFWGEAPLASLAASLYIFSSRAKNNIAGMTF
jgi:hypothetical protein